MKGCIESTWWSQDRFFASFTLSINKSLLEECTFSIWCLKCVPASFTSSITYMSLIGVYIVNLIEKLPIHFSSTIYLYIISSKQYFTNLKSEKMQAHLPKLSISQRPNETKVRPNGNKDKPQGHTPRHGIFFNLLPLTILWNGGKNWNIWLCHQHLSLPAHKPQCKVMPRKDLLHKRYGRLRGDFH